MDRYYELLGVAPGASARELKEAYRDLAKVWHPDRFSHDPRLQQKAQEKLKEINEAYDRLTSWKAGRPTRPNPAPDRPRAPAAAARRRKLPRLVFMTASLFCVAVLAALSSLLVPTGARPSADRKAPAEATEASASDKGQPRDSTTRTAAGQPARGKERAGRQADAEATTGGDTGSGPSAPTLRPMPTVTVKIDTLTGLLATRDCPNASTMTYPAGDEPRQYCTAHRKTKVQPEPERPVGSRLKSIGKGVAKPFKWLGGEGN
ncbi:MAG: J domain-containing protein [Pyrinomonadaceae bacterium]